MNFSELIKKIKEVKIQGAKNIARAGIMAMSMKSFNEANLLRTRPTEPALRNALEYAKRFGQKEALKHFEISKKKIKQFGYKKVKRRVFTHCHSGTVMEVLKEAKCRGKKFEVVYTETRPLYQGRKTAFDLRKYKIKSTMIIDSAIGSFLEKNNPSIKETVVMIGADAVIKDGGVINKIGSNMLAELAYNHKIPVYVVTDAWKFSLKNVKLEERGYKEIWMRAPGNIRIKNPSFEKVNSKYIVGIISELGVLKPKEFVKKVIHVYPWIR